MAKPVVSVVICRDPYESVKEALDLCDGLKDFRREDKILIKPNLVGHDFDYPLPFGVITTSAVNSALVKILAEGGYNHITIGEAPVMIPRTIGQRMYKVLGYDKLRERYGVELVDFNEEKFVPVDYGNFKLSLAQRALEADKIINVPVLKAHNQCKVSLGIKNLKGCLDRKSKQFCHGKEMEFDLERIFNQIIDKLPVALTVIDGIFALPRGPAPNGYAFRKDLIIASRDTYACDLVGAEIMDYKVKDVPHLRIYAERHGRSMDLADVEVRGEDVEKHRKYVDFDYEWLPDNTGPRGFAKRGISGLAARKWDSSLCTGCSMLYTPMLVMLMASYTGKPYPGIEVITGKRIQASPGFEKTLLFGKCPTEANKDNPNVKQAIKIKGCPPDLKEVVRAMSEIGVNIDLNQIDSFRRYMYQKTIAQEGYDMRLFQIS
ncbi:MAG: DUF362 domain-containing protein [Peptococcaceae bacterium]|nr:DUF362 domain-containing protein [Peptococcaceae bacterium]